MPPSAPSPERPQSEADLDFTPQRMVRWFNPLELVRAGTRAGLSTLFGAYADRREIQALQAGVRSSRDRVDMTTGTVRTASGDGSHEWYDLSDPDSLWIDYTADLGDGFDATYTVARLLAERRLQVGEHSTERGQVLVMGGDQVYPTASRTEYQNRLVGPYRAALPWVLDETPPLLFAVPGNHDWYDGLTSFLRLFTQGRWIGGWKTEQRRSYFAINLPHDWWLWAIDIQLDADIDKPQLDYFRALATDDSIMPAGSKVVLCTPEPSWVFAETEGGDAYQNLGYLEDKLIEANGHELAVGLAGDLHMYARYEATETGHQRIIAGGGGAYLYPTHDLPETLEADTAAGTHRFEMQPAPDGDSDAPVFPDVPTSRGLSWGALLLPFKNPRFGGAVALLYLLFAWLTQSATVRPSFGAADAPGAPSSLLTHLANTPDAGSALGAVLDATQHAPGATLLAVVLWVGLVAFADLKSWGGALVAGTLHAAAHLGLATALMWGFAVVNRTVGGLPATGTPHALLFVGEMAVFGGLLGGLLTGLYLILANRLLGLFGKKGVHANEVFSAQHIPHYKNFLRLHVGADGDLTLYPVGIPSVETHWSVRPDGGPEDPWFEGSAPLADRAELIEPPIRMDGTAHRE